jgi:hypothetical protein
MRCTTQIRGATMTFRHPSLFPYIDGVPNLTAYGDYALCYKHPDDLHLTPIFDEVSLAFIRSYLTERTWCRDAVGRGWTFTCLPSSELQSEGAIQ